MNRSALLLCLATSALVGACASATAAHRDEPCVLAVADSALLKGGPVYRDCAVDRPAKAVQTPVNWQPSAAANSRAESCFTADLQFVVNDVGRPEPNTIKIVGTNLPEFASAIMASIPLWSYQPALLGDSSVRQIVRVHKAVARVTVVTVGGQPRTTPRPPTNCR